MPITPTLAVEVQLAPGVWTDISADVVGNDGLRLRYGVDGSGPMDIMASTGECSFSLRNDAGNSGSTQGWYSPAHLSKRAGWTFGIPLRVTFAVSFVDAGAPVTKFRGRVRAIQPDPGIARQQRVQVVAYDGMGDLMDADVREVPIQLAATESELLEAMLDSLPADAQPVARDIDPGVDTYPYAFDDLEGGRKAGGLAKDIVQSAYGLGFFAGNGTFTYQNRNTRALGESVFHCDNTMHGLVVPASLDHVYNRVRVTIHPKTVDAAATTILASQTGTPSSIAAGDTQTIWLNYRDPDETSRLIGGTATVTPAATTDYLANDAADGTGTDRTASLTVVATAFASAVKFDVTNTHTGPVFVTRLQIRGKGIYDDGPRTLEAYTPKSYGDRPVTIDMPYQDNADTGQSAADIIMGVYQNPEAQVESVEFVANMSEALMTQALAREPGDLISISETVTGFNTVVTVIQSVEVEVQAGIHMTCRWGLAPAAVLLPPWQLGVAGFGELGETTILGF